MARSADEKEARLSELPLFKGAGKKAISHLASAADEVTVEAGHVLIRQGHLHSEVYVIESGALSVEVDGKPVAEIPAGELVGELGYFVRSAASATVKTAAETALLVIPYNRLEPILDENPQLVRAIADELAARLYAMDERFHQEHSS